MNKKGFTLIEMIATIALLALVATLATYSLSTHLRRGREKSFDVLVNTFEDGILEAYTSCIADPTSSEFCQEYDIPQVGERVRITLGTLEYYGFVEKFKNPWRSSEECDPRSDVIAIRDSEDAISFEYRTCLVCGNHRSEGCVPD